MQTNFSHPRTVEGESWAADRLQFRVRTLGHAASGSIEVADGYVHLVVFLPWLLAKLAKVVRPLIHKEGTLMPEKK